MDKETRPFVCFFLCLFVCLFVRCCVCGGRPSYGWTKRDASSKFKVGRGGSKNLGSTSKYTIFGQLVIRKINKIIATKLSQFKAETH